MVESLETKALYDDEGFAPFLGQLIDETLTRFTHKRRLFQSLVKLTFPAELEAIYEVDTKYTRVRELTATVTASIVLMVLITATDRTFVPDMGLGGLYIRLTASVVIGAAILSFRHLPGPRRELVLSTVAYVAVFALASVPLLSRSAQAPYGLFVWIFAMIYCNTTTPLRFRSALPFTLLCVVSMAILTPLSGRVNKDLSDALTFLAVVGAMFSLIANYRMERSIRLSYLLASKEALRLAKSNRNCDQLAFLSKTDALTGLSNRGYFDCHLDDLFASSTGLGLRVGLILIDVDHFKKYNDYYGHPAGDVCLRSIAAVITEIIRGKKGFGFRYGGEEFGALLLEVSGGTTESIAERIRLAVEREAIVHGGRVDGFEIVTVSAGVASAAIGDGGTTKELILRADASLYQAKKAGRNRTVFMSRGHSAA